MQRVEHDEVVDDAEVAQLHAVYRELAVSGRRELRRALR